MCIHTQNAATSPYISIVVAKQKKIAAGVAHAAIPCGVKESISKYSLKLGKQQPLQRRLRYAADESAIFSKPAAGMILLVLAPELSAADGLVPTTEQLYAPLLLHCGGKHSVHSPVAAYILKP